VGEHEDNSPLKLKFGKRLSDVEPSLLIDIVSLQKADS